MVYNIEFMERIAIAREHSFKKDGNTLVSVNFKVKEFACKDGTNKVLIDKELVEILKKYRDYINMPIIIVSRYRSNSHN